MLSITSEKNSVQSPQSQETGNLHIAEGTTNGEQSESRQSGAEHTNEEATSAEQGGSKTRRSESANKYGHAIFAGWAGERYVSWILKQILPYALWRTWWSAVSFQAPGNTCYVGTAAIARQEKPGMRKIEMDLLNSKRED